MARKNPGSCGRHGRGLEHNRRENILRQPMALDVVEVSQAQSGSNCRLCNRFDVSWRHLCAFYRALWANPPGSGQHLCPASKIRFWDENGFSLRPFIHPLKVTTDWETFQKVYTEDTSRRIYIRFFVRGKSNDDQYKLFGLFKSNIHLFGVDEGYIHLFGTDDLGRDVFSRVMYGGQISMSIGLAGVFLSLILGLILGGISGYYGGVVDNIIQRLIEVIRSFPRYRCGWR